MKTVTTFCLTCLFIVLSMEAVNAQTVTVSSAGTAEVDGVYTYGGDNHGKPYYVKAPYYIAWLIFNEYGTDYVGWHILELNPVFYYYNSADTPNPPISGWTVSVEGTASAPAPTLSGDVSLPVGLALFSAHIEGGSIILEWITESEVDNLGFIIERQIDGEASWAVIASYQTQNALKGQGNTSSQTEYNYQDISAESGINYRYRLSDVSTDGDVTIHPPLEITMDVLLVKTYTYMENAYPNPFNPQTFISYQLAESGIVEISVYDMLGRKVSMLLKENQNAGSYNIYWHGRDNSGQQASTGTYILRMSTGEIVQTQKVLLIR
ncbi:T9SS type A sorting domain-containing protein [candidate division KSB1 bacterium]|nr:T9SS type A sorting domain-containing protein [candidate division KSB1 bacterium]